MAAPDVDTRLSDLESSVRQLRDYLFDRPEPEPDTANATEDTSPEAPEDFYRREAGRLKEQAMVHAQAAKMWEARYHDAAKALEKAHQESEELRRSLSRIDDLVTQEGARANERAVYRTYDAERHTR